MTTANASIPSPQEPSANERFHSTIHSAKAAFEAGDYAQSLAQYEYFYDHVLEEAPEFSAVRSSYCLLGWMDLARQYPPALTRLEQKASATLAAFEQSHQYKDFTDFVDLCRFLGWDHLPIQHFLSCHASNPQLAQQIVIPVWDRLIQNKEWQVCATYLTDPQAQYKHILHVFDRLIQYHQNQTVETSDNELEKEIEKLRLEGLTEHYVCKISNILLVLQNTGQTQKASEILASTIADMTSRGHPELIARIQANLSKN